MTADRKGELVEADDRGWAELHRLLGALTEEQIGRVGYQEDWSVKDLLAHLGSWFAEAAMQLEQMRMGTFRPESMDDDGLNRAWYEAWRDKDLPIVMAELHSGRSRMLEEWSRLPEIDGHADEWFRESGPEHYDDHLPRLREWVSELRGGST
ncbi:MAG: maleylpyruvate isomerase N-terminal domain-containing protein [Actinomycetota bacterium]